MPPPICFVADNCNAAVKANEILVDMTEANITTLQAQLDQEDDSTAEDDESDYRAPEKIAFENLSAALNLGVDSIGCHAHLLKLVVDDALSEPDVADILSDLKAFVKQYKISSRTHRAVLDVCKAREVQTAPFYSSRRRYSLDINVSSARRFLDSFRNLRRGCAQLGAR